MLHPGSDGFHLGGAEADKDYSTLGVYIVVLYWDNGKENGNYFSILGSILGLYRGYIGVI